MPRTQTLLITTLLFAWLTLQSTAAETLQEIRTMPLTNVVGSECPTTGVRVETVTSRPSDQTQEIIVTIPKQIIHSEANFRLYRIDSAEYAFEDYKELHKDRYNDRRTFSFVVAESENIRFKIGFDSLQN